MTCNVPSLCLSITYLLLTIQLQQNSAIGVWMGIIFLMVGFALAILFWRWWNSVSDEDTAVDLRTRNLPIIHHGGTTAVPHPFYHPEAHAEESHEAEHDEAHH